MQIIHIYTKNIINQSHNISTQILYKFKISLKLIKTINNLKIFPT